MSISEPGIDNPSYTYSKSPDQSVIDETIARSRQIMKESEQITNRNLEIKQMLNKRLRSSNSISSKPDIVPKSYISDTSMSPVSFVKENRTNPQIFVTDERMHLSPSSPDKDVNAQSLLREIENLKNELTDTTHKEYVSENKYHPDTLKVRDYEDRLKGEEYLKLGYEKVANELNSRLQMVETENSQLKQNNQELKRQAHQTKSSSEELVLHNKEKERLKAEISKIQEFLEKYDADLNVANYERKTLQKENELLREEVARLKNASARNSPDVEKSALIKDLKLAKQQISRIQEDYDSEYQRMRSELKTERASKNDCSGENSQLVAENAQLMNRISTLEEKLGETERRYEQQSAYCEDLKDLVKAMRAVDNRSPDFGGTETEIIQRPKVKAKRRKSVIQKAPQRSVSMKKLTTFKKKFT